MLKDNSARTSWTRNHDLLKGGVIRVTDPFEEKPRRPFLLTRPGTVLAVAAVIMMMIGAARSHPAHGATIKQCEGARSWDTGRTSHSYCRSRNPSVFSVYGKASTLGNTLKLHLVCGMQKLDASFVVGKHFEKSASPASLSQKQRDMYQLMRAHSLCSLTVSFTPPPKAQAYSNEFHILWHQRLTVPRI